MILWSESEDYRYQILLDFSDLALLSQRYILDIFSEQYLDSSSWFLQLHSSPSDGHMTVYSTNPLKKDLDCSPYFGITNKPPQITVSICHSVCKFFIDFRHTRLLDLSITPASWNASPSVYYVFGLLCAVGIFLIFSVSCAVHTTQMIDQPIQSIAVFTFPGKSKVSAARDPFFIKVSVMGLPQTSGQYKLKLNM